MRKEGENPNVEPLVADVYRELARERVPDRLNEEVLRLAAEQSRTPYARARAWMRPTAWAATIGLSFAIVLELAQFPGPEAELPAIAVSDDRPEPPASPASERRLGETTEPFVPRDMDVLRDAENKARLQAGPDQAAATREPIVQAPQAQAPGATLRKREDTVVEIDGDVREEVAAADLEGEIAAVRSLSAITGEKERATDLSCPAESRKTAEAWYDCIKELRASGAHDLADREFEAFLRVFPDFVEPEADK